MTQSEQFPTTPGALQPEFTFGSGRGFVIKLRPDGSDLAYGTYLGGVAAASGTDASAVAVRPDGAAIVVGESGSAELVTTAGTYQPVKGGATDAYISVLTPDGSALEWSTFLGTGNGDRALAVAVGDDGAVTVAGRAGKPDFPTTPGALVWNKPITVNGNSLFITRFEPDGSALRWSALIGWAGGGEPHLELDVGPDGRTVFTANTQGIAIPVTPGAVQPRWIANSDGFVTVLSADGSTVLGGTYVGWLGNDLIRAVQVDGSGVITLGGSGWFPETWLTEPLLSPSAPAIGAFLFRLSPDCSRVLFAQEFGGATAFKVNETRALGLFERGQVGASGSTATVDFPTTPGAFQPDAPGNTYDGFVLRHRMLPAGVHAIGRSGPACATEAYLGASGPPQAGSASFAVYASNLPPNAQGWLALGAPLDPPLFLGALPLHVRLDAPHVLVPWHSGPTGYAALDLPLPLAAAGLEFAAQIAVTAPAPCAADIAWTHALTVTVAP